MRLPIVVLALALVLTACGDDDVAPADGGRDSGHRHGGDDPCGRIIDACHPLDTGGDGPIPECHAIGHDEIEAACEENLDRCLAACVADGGPGAPDAGPHDDGGSHADPDGGTASVCRLVARRCHDLDPGDGGPISQCHDLGHAGDEALCVERRDECLALCPEST